VRLSEVNAESLPDCRGTPRNAAEHCGPSLLRNAAGTATTAVFVQQPSHRHRSNEDMEGCDDGRGSLRHQPPSTCVGRRRRRIRVLRRRDGRGDRGTTRGTCCFRGSCGGFRACYLRCWCRRRRVSGVRRRRIWAGDSTSVIGTPPPTSAYRHPEMCYGYCGRLLCLR